MTKAERNEEVVKGKDDNESKGWETEEEKD